MGDYAGLTAMACAGRKKDQNKKDQTIDRDSLPAALSFEGHLHIHEITVNIGNEIRQKERQDITPGDDTVDHIGSLSAE